MKIIFDYIGKRLQEIGNVLEYNEHSHDNGVRIKELGKMLIDASEKITDIEFE